MQVKELDKKYKDMLLEKKYLTTKELGAVLGLTKQRVNQLKNRYNLPAVRINGADVFSIDEIKKIGEKRREFHINYVALTIFNGFLPDGCEKIKKCIALGLMEAKRNDAFARTNAIYVNKEELDEKVKELYKKDISDIITKRQAEAVLNVDSEKFDELIVKYNLCSIKKSDRIFVKKSEVLQLKDRLDKRIKAI